MLEQIFFSILNCEFGKIQILSLEEDGQIIKLDFLSMAELAQQKKQDYGTFLKINYPQLPLIKSTKKTFDGFLGEYFNNSQLSKKANALLALQDLCVEQTTTIHSLSRIEMGSVVSYTDFSAMVKNKSVRACASRLAQNNIPLIFPCHRVVPKGSIDEEGEINGVGDYIAGKKIKEQLLELEGVSLR